MCPHRTMSLYLKQNQSHDINFPMDKTRDLEEEFRLKEIPAKINICVLIYDACKLLRRTGKASMHSEET